MTGRCSRRPQELIRSTSPTSLSQRSLSLDDVKAVLTAVSDIAKADQMEAGILATVLATEKKSLFRSAWRVLGQLSTGLPAASARRLCCRRPRIR